MKSLRKQTALGFYLSLSLSIAIITIVSFWDFSYISKIYSVENQWNENITLRLTKLASGESVSKDLENLQGILDSTRKLPLVKEESISILKNSISQMRMYPLNTKIVMDSFNIFHSLVNEARTRAMNLLIAISFLLVAFNVFVLSFLILKPQRYLLNSLNSISEDLNDMNIGKMMNPRYSRYKETLNLVSAFNSLIEKFSIYRDSLRLTERSRTVDDLTAELFKNLKSIIRFNGICFVGIEGERLKVEAFVSDSEETSVRLPTYLDLRNTISKETMEDRKPRIVNDFELYSEIHPEYESVRIALNDGMRSGVIFPIFIEDLCIGFMFLFSRDRNHFSGEDLQKLGILEGFLSLAYQKTSITHELILSSTIGFTKLVEEKDNDTGEHIQRMAAYSKEIAEGLSKNPKYSGKITPKYVKSIYEQAPLHDIGKVGIPDRVLMKPGKLTEEEFEEMKKHTVIGHEILRKVDERSTSYGKKFFEMGSEIARHHHERWDGTGYPDGLRGEDIPLCARIVAVADVFDALTSRRPYKEAMDFDTAIGMIAEESGTHFDPEIVDAFRKNAKNLRSVYERPENLL